MHGLICVWQDRSGLETLKPFGRGKAAGLVDEVAEGALQFQTFGGEGAGGRAEKLIGPHHQVVARKHGGRVLIT